MIGRASFERDALAEADRGAAADADQAIGAELPCLLPAPRTASSIGTCETASGRMPTQRVAEQGGDALRQVRSRPGVDRTRARLAP